MWHDKRKYAKIYFCKELEEAALSYILEHFETIANSASEEFNGLDCQELEELLGYDELNVRSEEHAFKAIVKWISIDPASRSQNMSNSLYFYTKKVYIWPCSELNPNFS